MRFAAIAQIAASPRPFGSGGASVAPQTRRAPGRSVGIVEARQALGGTWDLFRYPGVRSDPDLYTLGYSFRPWTGTKSASAARRAV